MMTTSMRGRLGGVAATLAAGGIIGLGTAALASAAPADPSTGPAADAPSADAPNAPRRASATANTRRAVATDANPDSARTVSVRPGASAARVVPRPAAVRASAQSTRPAIPATAIPASAIPASEAVARVVTAEPRAQASPESTPGSATSQVVWSQAPQSSAATPNTPAAGSATTAVSTATPAPRAAAVGGLFPCDPRGQRITIFKGVHFVVPNRWGLWLTKVSGDATFTADSVYDLKDEDQYDWNKLAGITYTPWRPERNAAMVVWRYNLQKDVYEVGPFFDDNFAYVFPSEDQIITVPKDQTFDYSVDYQGITVTYGDRTVFKPYPEDLKPNFWTSARVTGWFGGSEVAPRTLTYYLHMR